jgi:restriction system protein
MTAMWMVRSDGGRRYDDFRDRAAVGIGFVEIAALAKPGTERKTLVSAYLQAVPGMKEQAAVVSAAQVYRFVNEIAVDDWVISYSPDNRTYLVGTVTGPAEHHPDWEDQGMGLALPITWQSTELNRDDLSQTAKNSLGSTLTVFKLSDAVRTEVLGLLHGTPAPVPVDDVAEADDPLRDYPSIAFEQIKDRVSSLDWAQMQDLVAGILRAMGYKTQVSPPGSDLGRDILASPDGFGFERPRIVVEVKHRKETMGSKDIRGFLGGRHPEDRGLYVSTGGFTKDARYEADRSTVPLALWTLEELTKALVDNYENTDAVTRSLIALRPLYVPVDVG